MTNLFLKTSAYSRVSPFSTTFSTTSLAIINHLFSVDDLATMPIEELTQFIMKKGKSHFSHPDEIINNLKRVAKESYRLKPELMPSVNLILESTCNNIRCYKEQVKIVDEAIAENLKAFRHTLESISGIDPLYAAEAEIDHINRFPNDSALAQFTALTWPIHQLGKFKADIQAINTSDTIL